MSAISDRRKFPVEFLAAAWPPLKDEDSESQRRKKIAVRGGQLALTVMVAAAIFGTIIAEHGAMTGSQITLLLGAGLAYLGWSLNGISRAVQFLLWEGAAPPPATEWPGKLSRMTAYFAVQLALAATVNYLGGQARNITLTWLVLLPPVAHSVILLRRLGIVVVSTVTLAIFVTNVVWLYGWKPVPTATLQFSFSLLFTVVFTLLAVSSEKARAQAQWLASELTEANRKLREHAAQAEELATTRERNRLAREIHDNLGHCLTVVNMQIEAARALWERDPERAREGLEKAQLLTQQSLAEIRHSVAALRASPLENKSLAQALAQIVEENRAAGLTVELQIHGDSRALSPQTELTLYRAAQEGLTNVRKHAKATRATLTLDFRAAEQTRLSVTDDGVGDSGATKETNGFGLLGLRERTQLLGGTVRTESLPGKGFTLEVEVPG